MPKFFNSGDNTSPMWSGGVFSFPIPTFDDLQVGIRNVAKGSPAPTDSTYAYGIGSGVAYPTLGIAKGDILYFDIQTSHSMKLSTILDVHIHFTLPNTTDVGHKIQWQLDVIASPIGGTWAVPTGSPFSTIYTVIAGDNTSHRLFDLADIPAVNTTVSTTYKCKLTRIDGEATEYASMVYLDFIDCHYQKDTIGSQIETVK